MRKYKGAPHFGVPRAPQHLSPAQDITDEYTNQYINFSWESFFSSFQVVIHACLLLGLGSLSSRLKFSPRLRFPPPLRHRFPPRLGFLLTPPLPIQPNLPTDQPFSIGRISITYHFFKVWAIWYIHAKFQPNRFRNGSFSQIYRPTNQSTNQQLSISRIALTRRF